MMYLSGCLRRFDTYRSKDESRRLAQYVSAVEDGMILAMVVNDEGSNNLEDTAKKVLNKLGSRELTRLGFRYVLSFIFIHTLSLFLFLSPSLLALYSLPVCEGKRAMIDQADDPPPSNIQSWLSTAVQNNFEVFRT